MVVIVLFSEHRRYEKFRVRLVYTLMWTWSGPRLSVVDLKPVSHWMKTAPVPPTSPEHRLVGFANAVIFNANVWTCLSKNTCSIVLYYCEKSICKIKNSRHYKVDKNIFLRAYYKPSYFSQVLLRNQSGVK